ncbi:MAG: TonB-dependent receptor [Vicinamibacterales bacterium]
MRITLQRSALALAGLVLVANSARAQTVGAVAGRVTDLLDGRGVPQAVVTPDAGRAVTTGSRGEFQLLRLPSGTRRITVTVAGYLTQEIELDIAGGRRTEAEITLVPDIGRLSGVEISPIEESRVQALKVQRSLVHVASIVAADQAGRLPDTIVVESLQRLPGVAIERDQGQGRYAAFRGLPVAHTSVVLNGAILMSPEDEVRPIALDVIPTNIVQRMEVSRTSLPSMDPDGIGGVVSLFTEAPRRTSILGTMSGGYNALRKSGSQYLGEVSGGWRRAGLGLFASVSDNLENRGAESVEASHGQDGPEEIELRHYTVERRRTGGSATIDRSFGASGLAAVNLLYSRFADSELRRRSRRLLDDHELERDLKNRFQEQVLGSASVRVQHELLGRRFEHRAGWTYGREAEPDRMDTAFLQEDVLFGPTAIAPTFVDAAPLNESLDRSTLSSLATSDSRMTARGFSLASEVTLAESPAGRALRAGASLRHASKARARTSTEFGVPDASFPAFMDSTFRPGDFLHGRTSFGAGLAEDAGARLMAVPDLETEIDHGETALNFSGIETVAGAYLMQELPIAERWLVVPGLRVEHYRLDYDGLRLVLPDGMATGTSNAAAHASWFPSTHVRFLPDANTVVRAAVTTNIARPSYEDLIPRETIDEDDREILRGDTALKPTRALSFDVSVERYLGATGLLSTAAFHKRVSDYVWHSWRRELIDDESYDVSYPLNGKPLRLQGVELAYEQRFTFLPQPLQGLSLYSTVAFTRADVTGKDIEQLGGALPGEPRRSGNVEVSFERRRLSARAGMNIHGAFRSSADDSDPDARRVYARRAQLDTSVAFALAPHWRVFLDGANLTNAPVIFYDGTPDRPVQIEYYRPWYRFGLRFDF